MTPLPNFIRFFQKSLKKYQNFHFPRGFWENHPNMTIYNDLPFYGFFPEVPMPLQVSTKEYLPQEEKFWLDRFALICGKLRWKL